MKNDIKNNQLYDAFFSTKGNLKFHLDNQNFGNQCFSVNDLLIKHSLFLRIYDSKDNFHYLIKQDSEKKKQLREIYQVVSLKSLTVLTSSMSNLAYQ